jgi:hypothetical protein
LNAVNDALETGGARPELPITPERICARRRRGPPDSEVPL